MQQVSAFEADLGQADTSGVEAVRNRASGLADDSQPIVAVARNLTSDSDLLGHALVTGAIAWRNTGCAAVRVEGLR